MHQRLPCVKGAFSKRAAIDIVRKFHYTDDGIGKEYFNHNKELLFYERQKEIIREIEKLELED
jgi:hypothetical protein